MKGKINDQASLDALYAETTFAKEKKAPTWDNLKVTKEKTGEDYPLGCSIHVPQCSYFGGTMIAVADTYERHGEDCLFIQELMRLYHEGRIQVQ
jgi:hypothetical protein